MTGLGHFFVSAHKEGPPAGPARGAPEIRSTSRNDLVRSAIKDGYTTRGAWKLYFFWKFSLRT